MTKTQAKIPPPLTIETDMSLFDEYVAERSGAEKRAESMQENAATQTEAMNKVPSSLFDEYMRDRAESRPAAIPMESQPQEVKTNNPAMGFVARGAELAANAAEGYSRAQNSPKLDQSVFAASPVFGAFDAIRKSLEGQAGREQEKEGINQLEKWASSTKDYAKSIGYAPTTKLGDIPGNPLSIVPFIAERVVTSLPDMAAAVMVPEVYIATRTNEILNERLKNDKKSFEEATFADVAASAIGAVIETTLEKFATKRLLKGGRQGATAGGRIAREVGIQSGTEALEEGAANIAGSAGTVRGIDYRELGEQMLEGAIVGGGLGGSVQGAREVYEKAAPNRAIANAIQADVDSTNFSNAGIEQTARLALDPNLGDEQRRKITQDSLSDIATGALTPQQQIGADEPDNPLDPSAQVSEQPGTAVNNIQTEPNQAAAPLSTDNEMARTAGQVDQAELESMLQQVDSGNQQLLSTFNQTESSAERPETLTQALQGVATDLELQPGETLNVQAVTQDKRLNKFADALSQAFGVQVHWVDFGAQGMTTSTGRNLGRFNGYRYNDTILVSPNQDFMDTTWHELTHTLETKHPEVYAALRDTILRTVDPTVKAQLYASLNARRQQEVGRNMGNNELESELVAMVTGQQAATPEMLRQLFDGFQDKSIAKQFHDILMEIFDKLSSALRGPQYLKDRQRVIEARNAIKTAFSEYQKREAAKAMPPALAQRVAVSRGATNTTQVGRAQQGGFQQYQGIDYQLRPQGADTQGQGASFQAQGITPSMPSALAQKVAISKGAKPATNFERTLEEHRVTQGRFAESIYARAIEETPQDMIDMYLDRFGREVNPDHARELSPIYLMNPVDFAAAVHEPSSRLAKMVYDHLLRTASPTDVVRFVAGGGGSGKGYVISKLSLAGDNTIIYDAVMGKLNSAVARIEQALQAGLNADMFYVNTPATQAFKNALARAERIGRTVPITILAEAHVGASNTIRELHQRYSSTFPVTIVNSGNNTVEYGTLSDVPEYNTQRLIEEFTDELERQVAGGYNADLAAAFKKTGFSRGFDFEWTDERDDARILGEGRSSNPRAQEGDRQRPEQPDGQVDARGREAARSQGQGVNARAGAPGRAAAQEQRGEEGRDTVGKFSRSTVPMMQMSDADARRELGLDPRINNVRAVGAALNAKTASEDGVIDDKNTSEAAMEEIADILVGEISYQLGVTSATGTGLGWYSANYPNAVRRLSRLYPELATDAGARNVLTAIVAITSNGEKVSTNFANALKIYDRFRDGGSLQPVGTRRGSMASTLDRLQALIDQFGMDGFHEHLLEELTVAEINASLRAAGQKAQSSYTADTIMPRAALYFGPKLGAFYSNLMGSEGYLTMDMWWSRTFNRIRGTLVPEPTQSSIESVRGLLGLPENTDDEVVAMIAVPYMESYKAKGYKNGTELERKANTLVKNAFLELNEAPFRASDRSFMIQTTMMAQDKLAQNGVKLTLADIQAALWYYEKRLYAKLTGRQSDDIGYEEAILSYAEGDRPQRPPARFNRGGASGTVGERGGAEAAANVPVKTGEAEDRAVGSEVATQGVQGAGVQETPALRASARDLEFEEITAEEPINTVGNFSRSTVLAAINGERNAPDLFAINLSPSVLRALGAPNETLVIRKDVLQKVGKPESVGKSLVGFQEENLSGRVVERAGRIPLTVDEIRDIPRMIGNPVAVIDIPADQRYNRRKSYKVIVDLVKNGYPVAVIVVPNNVVRVKGQAGLVTEIRSIYPTNSSTTLDATSKELRGEPLLYFNKQKAAALFAKVGNKLPGLLRGPTGRGVKAPEDFSSLEYGPHRDSNFSRSIDEDMVAQSAYLTEKAKEAGFDDVDAWVDSDYDGFVKAASEWRAENPVGAFSRQLQGNVFTLPARTIRERAANLFSNEVSRVSAVQQAVQEQGGVVTEETNTENALHRMYGRAGNRIDEFRKKTLKPILDAAAKAEVSLDDVALYMYANHAIERNAHIRSINPQQFQDGGSGMLDKDARDVLRDLRARGGDFVKIKNIADRIQRITEQTGQALLDGGLIDAATLQAWRSNYSYYVPLKGFEQIDENGQTGNGRFDPRDPFFKRALGRRSRAGQLIENVLRDYEEAVVAAEKNKWRQTFLKFVLQNKDSALWEVDPMVLQRRFNKNQNLVDFALAVDDSDARTIGVRVNGVPRSIRVNDPGMLADLKLQGAISGSDGVIKSLFGAWSSINRTLGKLWTALSPAFVLTNAKRDLQFAIGGTAVERGAGAAVDVAKDFIPAAYAIMRAERDNNWGQNSELKAYYDMYRADGGKTGFLDLRSLEQRQSQLLSDFSNASASVKDPKTYHRLALRYIQNAEDFIMDVNGGIENAARVAAYKSVIERAGYNAFNAPKSVREEAASVAKNLTVNFNRRGKLTPLLSSFYLFFNPAVQGALRTSQLVFSKKGGMLAGSLVALGYLVATMAEGALGADDEPFWDKDANRSAKLKNLVFFGPNGEQYTVPLAYGLGFFVNLGYAIKDLQGGKNPWKVAAFMRDSLFVHFSPLGAAENVATFAAPTLLDPIIVSATGTRENGAPLMPQDASGTTPDSERYWTSTRNTVLQRFTSWMNEATGGSEATPGAISVSPETLGYSLSFVGGGAGTFVKDVINSIDLTLNVGPDAAMDKNAYPILKSFYRRDTGRADQQAFFENSKTVKQAKEESKLLDGDRPSRNAISRASINEAYSDLASLQRSSQKQLNRLRKEEIEIMDNTTLSRRDKYEKLKQVDQQRRGIEQEFNREFYGVKRQVGERSSFADGGVIGERGTGIARDGIRHAERVGQPFEAKRNGWLGRVKNGGETSTEISEDDDKGSYPLMVPGLTGDELKSVLAKQPLPSAIKRARDWRDKRAAAGKSPFYEGNELRLPVQDLD